MWLACAAVSLGVACNPQPSVTQVGDLTPSWQTDMPELETTALGPPWSQSRCGNPAGVSELLVASGSQLIRVRSDQLGSAATRPHGIPVANPTFDCGGTTMHTYNRTFDANISRLPDGRLIYVELAKTQGPGPGCPVPLPRALIIEQSFNCGSSWGSKVLSATTIEPDFPFIDRQSLFVDVAQQTMYLAFRMSSELGGGGSQRTVLLRDSTNDVTLSWKKVLSNSGYTGNVTAMTARQDDNDEALMFLQCSGTRPRLTRVINPATSDGEAFSYPILLDALPSCQIVSGSLTSAHIRHAVPQLSIAPLAGGAVEEYRLVYPGIAVADGGVYQTLHIVDISLDLTVLPVPVSILRQRTIDYSAGHEHVLYPDLVYTEGFESALGVRFQHVLTYTRMRPDAVETVQTEIWRNQVEGWLAPVAVQAPVAILPDYLKHLSGGLNFFGDYKEGTFLDQDMTRARFFAPWSRTRIGQGMPDVKVYGAVIEP